jgi:hypothetical protein
MRTRGKTVLGRSLAWCLASLTLGIASRAGATTYQVGPGKTYASLADVANMLMPGDIVEVDGNHTYAGGVIIDKSGTAVQKITIRGVRMGGNRPVLSGATNTIEIQGSHIVVEGIELTAGTFRCFYHHGDDVTLRDSVIHDCPRHGLLGADNDSGSLLMEYVEIYRCGGGDRDHQVYMATDERTHAGAVFRMQHCYVHDGNGGNNVKSRAERNEIYYNWLEGAFYHELELIGPDPAGGTAENLKREDSDVVGNVIWQKNTSAVLRFGGDGTGQSNGRYRFVNNTVIAQPGGGAVFRLFDGLESVEMHNNVLFAASGGVNLKRELEAVWSTGQPVIAGSNNWVSMGSTNAPTQWTGTITGADPSFVAARDLRPTASSPLVDKGNGAPMGPAAQPFSNAEILPRWHPPMGALEAVGSASPRTSIGAIDLGAFEYGDAVDGGSAATSGAGGTGSTGGAGGATGGASGTGSGSTSSTGGAATSSSTTGAGGDGTSSGAGGAATTGGANASPGDEGGCGCRAARASHGLGGFALLAAATALARRRGPSSSRRDRKSARTRVS